MDMDSILLSEVNRYTTRLDVDEVDLTNLNLRHTNVDTTLTDSIASVLIVDGELTFRINDLMLNSEYLESKENVTFEAKILILSKIEFSNNKTQ